MSENESKSASPLISSETIVGEAGNANIVYFLYLFAFIFPPTALVGVLIANVNRANAEGWVRGHYEYQIWTFWITLMAVLAGFVVIAVSVELYRLSLILMVFACVFLVVRCVKGLQASGRRQSPSRFQNRS